MKRVKTGLLFMSVLMMSNMVKAQSLEDGRKFLYYEKYISAKNVFQKLVAANPADGDAAYWLGQTNNISCLPTKIAGPQLWRG